MEDVQLETRKLTQTQLQFSQEEEEMDEEEAARIERGKKYRKLNAQLLADRGQNPQMCLEGIRWIADFFEEQGVWSNLETWLSRGIQWAPHKEFFTRLYKLYREKPDGNVCHALACNYIDGDRFEEGIRLLMEGAGTYQDEDCAELLEELMGEE